MAFPSPFLFPSDDLFPVAFSAPPPPPPGSGGVESLILDGLELNDGQPWTVMKDPSIDWTPPKKKLNWVSSPLSDGSALTGSEDHYENGEIVLTLGLQTQTSKDAALRQLNALTQKIQAARQTPGGLSLVWTPGGSASSLTYYVIEAEYDEFDIHREEGWFTNAPTFRVHFYVRPFGYGAEQRLDLGYSDQFLFNSLVGGPWRIDGGGTELGIAFGKLACTGTTINKRIYAPYTTEDVEVAMLTQINAGFGLCGVRFKRTGTFTHLFVGVDLPSNTLQIRTYVSSNSATVLETTGFTPTLGNDYWIVGTIHGNEVFAGVYDETGILVDTPIASVTHDLTTSGFDDDFGEGVRGQTGIQLNPTSTGGPVVDQFRVTGMEDVTSAEPVACLDLAGILGDVEAEARQAVTEASAVTRNHYEWGLESDEFDPTLTWPYVLDSDYLASGSLLTGLNGVSGTLSGNIFDPNTDSSTNVIRSSGALSSTTPVNICSTGALRHVGAYKVKARVMAFTLTAGADSGMRVRLAWRVGEGSFTTNDYASVDQINTWYEVDLGMVNIVDTGLANQTWTGRIQAYNSAANGLLFYLDYIMLIPLESWGAARNPVRPVVADTFSILDHFSQSAGPLTGKAMEAGAGTWGYAQGSGFTVSGSGTVTRNSGGDAIGQGNKATAGSGTFSGIQVQADVRMTAGSYPNADATGSYRQGILARYTTTDYWVAMVLQNVQTGSGPGPTQATRLQIWKSTLAGGVVSMGKKDFPDRPEVQKTLMLNIDAAGYWQAYCFAGKQPSRPTLQGWDANLVSSDPNLGTGKVGLYDAYSPSATPPTRIYDNFIAFAQPVDSVLFASEHLEVRSDRTIRESSTGGSFGKVPRYFGDRFFLPPAGDKQDVCRLAWKARRTDVDGSVPDTAQPGSDATTLSVYYTPRYLLPSGGA